MARPLPILALDNLDLSIGLVARAVPEVKDFDPLLWLINDIEDDDGGVYQLADTRPFSNGAADVREGPENLQMVEQGRPERLSAHGWRRQE